MMSEMVVFINIFSLITFIYDPLNATIGEAFISVLSFNDVLLKNVLTKVAFCIKISGISNCACGETKVRAHMEQVIRLSASEKINNDSIPC